MTRNELNILLSERAGELVYTYERFSDGSSEYFIHPYERGRDIEGAAMRYRFTREGENK